MPRFGFNYEPRLFRSRRQSLLVDNSAPVSSFSPDDLPSLQLWLDASDASTLTVTGSVVDQWRDKSGNSYNMSSSGASRPLLVSSGSPSGRNVIQFDGVDDTMSVGSTGLGKNVSAVTVYCVVKWLTVPSGSVKGVIVSGREIASSTRFGIIANLTPLTHGAGGRRTSADLFQFAASSSSVTALQWYTNVAVFDYINTDLLVYVDGALGGSNTSFQTSGLTDNVDSAGSYVGSGSGGNYADVSIGEILVYHAAHGSFERSQVLAYFNSKWGV